MRPAGCLACLGVKRGLSFHGGWEVKAVGGCGGGGTLSPHDHAVAYNYGIFTVRSPLLVFLEFNYLRLLFAWNIGRGKVARGPSFSGGLCSLFRQLCCIFNATTALTYTGKWQKSKREKACQEHLNTQPPTTPAWFIAQDATISHSFHDRRRISTTSTSTGTGKVVNILDIFCHCAFSF